VTVSVQESICGYWNLSKDGGSCRDTNMYMHTGKLKVLIHKLQQNIRH